MVRPLGHFAEAGQLFCNCAGAVEVAQTPEAGRHPGEAALAGKDYTTAADRYARADAIFHAPTLLLGLARAEVGLGRLVEAEETYRRIVAEGLPPKPTPAFVAALAAALVLLHAGAA